MRQLGHLYSFFKKSVPNTKNASDLFKVRYFRPSLEDAIEEYSTFDNGKLKSGMKCNLFYLLKCNLFYLLKNASRILQGNFRLKELDDEADSMVKWDQVLELKKDFLFGEAVGAINIRRQTKLRKPDKLPDDGLLHQLLTYMQRRAAELFDSFQFWDYHQFRAARDIAVARLTLFNGSRRGTPCALTLEQFADAASGAWLPPSKRKVEMDFKVTYQPRKRGMLVAVLIPKQVVDWCKVLADQEVRTACKATSSKYLFSVTKKEDGSHVDGWTALKTVCRGKDRPNKTKALYCHKTKASGQHPV